MNASAVSRALRERGLRPLPSGTSRDREGLRVAQNRGTVIVTADFDSRVDAIESSTAAYDAALSAGMIVERTRPDSFVVIGKRPKLTPHQQEVYDRARRTARRLGGEFDQRVVGSRGAVGHLVSKGYLRSRLDVGQRGGVVNLLSVVGGEPRP